MSSAPDTQPSEKLDYEPFDPDSFRMSIGDHLEELRWRLILSLLGFVVVLGVCLYFGNTVVAYFCRPLLVVLKTRGLPPWMVDRQLGGSFMVFLRISLVSAAALSAPWIVYQLWQFVAAGLYPHERKYVTKYVPLSIFLMISGMLFVYFLVLPWTIEFFIDWTASMPIPNYSQQITVSPTTQPLQIPVYDGDPDLKTLSPGPTAHLWFNKVEGKLNIVVDGVLRSVPFAPMSLVVPQYELDDYIDLVIGLLLVFALSFQLPLVVLALVRIGIVEIDTLRNLRRYVYFGMVVLAATITPGDVITATMALVVPLCLLYELGIFLAVWGGKKAADRAG